MDKKFRDGKAFVGPDETLAVIEQNEVHRIEVDEEQRHLIIKALADLSMKCPGWINALEEIALKMDNRTGDGRPEMFESFRRIRSDAVARKLLS